MAIGIVGLPPDYSYPGDTRRWWLDTTSQAANLGAAFITRSLMRQLDAEFVPLDTPPELVEERFDSIVLALATHLHRRREEAKRSPYHGYRRSARTRRSGSSAAAAVRPCRRRRPSAGPRRQIRRSSILALGSSSKITVAQCAASDSSARTSSTIRRII